MAARWRVWTAAAALSLAGIAPAAAQGMITDGQQIARCLCLDRSVKALSQEFQAHRRAYEQARANLDALNREVEAARVRVDVNNPADVDAFKRLIDRRDQAADRFAGEDTESYGQSVAQYNQAVESYNYACVGRQFDADVLARVQATLYCPR